MTLVLISFVIPIFLIYIGKKSKAILSLLFSVLKIPLFIANILKNLPKFALDIDTTVDYMWAFDPNPLGVLTFIIISGMFILIILKTFTSKNIKLKRGTMWLIFIFYTASIIIKVIYEIKTFLKDEPASYTIGGGNFPVLIGLSTTTIIPLFLLYKLNRKFNLKYLFKTGLYFIFLLSEVFLAILVSILLVKTDIDENAKLLDFFSRIAYYLILVYFTVLLFEILKEKLIDLMERSQKFKKPILKLVGNKQKY